MSMLRDYWVQLDEQSEGERTVLGSGAYGTVFNVKVKGAACVAKRVHDILLGTQGHEPVSIDQWRPVLEKFHQECKLLSRMRHPNVVQFIGVCELVPGEPRSLALVMERLHTDLRRYIDEANGEIPLPVKLRVLHDTSSGLLYLHSHDVIHRDINAGNVLLTESLRAKVADLGVARVMESMTGKKLSVKLSRMPGCHDYMPPEASQQVPEYGKKLDCFSFGHLMLYLIIQCDPTPHSLTHESLIQPSIAPGGFEIQKRQHWIDQIIPGHPLRNLVLHCLQDKSSRRPEMKGINQQLDLLCQAHPQNAAQSQTFNQLLEQLTLMKQTACELMSEPLEMVNLLQHVSVMEEQNIREAQLIQQAKEQVHFSKKLIQRRSEWIESLSSQMHILGNKLIQMDPDTQSVHCAHLEEKIRLLEEENAAKDLQLVGARTELQRVREESQQALTRIEKDYLSLRELKDIEIAKQKERINRLELQISELQGMTSKPTKQPEKTRRTAVKEANNQDQSFSCEKKQEQSNHVTSDLMRRSGGSVSHKAAAASCWENASHTLDRRRIIQHSKLRTALNGHQRPVSGIVLDNTTMGGGEELASILQMRRKHLSEHAEVNRESPQPEQPRDGKNEPNMDPELWKKLQSRRSLEIGWK